MFLKLEHPVALRRGSVKHVIIFLMVLPDLFQIQRSTKRY